MNQNLSQLPADLPVPVDDGAADHLVETCLPDVDLSCTDGRSVNLSTLKGRWVIYVYPMTGRPDGPLPDGWDSIPGARGCTPQSCSFRDRYSLFQDNNIGVVGLSSQATEYLREARDRLHLPFELLSDDELHLRDAMRLPTFFAAGIELYKRLTMIAEDGKITKVFYRGCPEFCVNGVWVNGLASDPRT